jgi:hypothetical protein
MACECMLSSRSLVTATPHPPPPSLGFPCDTFYALHQQPSCPLLINSTDSLHIECPSLQTDPYRAAWTNHHHVHVLLFLIMQIMLLNHMVKSVLTICTKITPKICKNFFDFPHEYRSISLLNFAPIPCAKCKHTKHSKPPKHNWLLMCVTGFELTHSTG